MDCPLRRRAPRHRAHWWHKPSHCQKLNGECCSVKAVRRQTCNSRRVANGQVQHADAAHLERLGVDRNSYDLCTQHLKFVARFSLRPNLRIAKSRARAPQCLADVGTAKRPPPPALDNECGTIRSLLVANCATALPRNSQHQHTNRFEACERQMLGCSPSAAI